MFFFHFDISHRERGYYCYNDITILSQMLMKAKKCVSNRSIRKFEFENLNADLFLAQKHVMYINKK